MIRNDLLMEQALATGYDDKSSVRKNYHQQREEYLAREFGIRYHSKRFQEEYPDEWQKYDQALTKARDENELSVHLENMFPDVSNPDSILTAAPVQVFLKNRYVW